MKDTRLTAFIMGMASLMAVFGLLVLVGPGLVPSQLNACWVELEKQSKDCSTKQNAGRTYIKDSRCLTPSKGMFMVAEDDSGWYLIGRQPAPSDDAAEDSDSDADEPNR